MTLRVERLTFGYPDKPVLRSVNTGDLPVGRLTALLGPNAAGKSTFFRCVAGLQQPQAGQVLLAGNDLHAATRAELIRDVCYMPQSFSSNAALTVFEVVLLARKQLQDWRVHDDDVSAVSHLLLRFGIQHLAERYIAELSGGQQQMVALCQAMVRRGRLFLLDEPTSALDLRHQLEVMQTLREITREREAVTIAAMHDLNLAARFADHILLMEEGRVVASGATDDVLCSSELARTYGVDIELQRSRDGVYMVGARI
ncbi:ABC transporter ATP-binding protein [Sedimenticola thiotaurini]|uniref:Iron ABC transporter ATP-binding protein n=1 Tax=Sedimenticola thiotaurini TaxID=1543721 RepID=A0A0F7JZ81_9GAMM|nr:ABC transporter ATP-binding protein [Sedimenticola thiotaurini]AKH20579.1 iron ABC transporter ATP-binding protein [Sedimenticola thiotaurini]